MNISSPKERGKPKKHLIYPTNECILLNNQNKHQNIFEVNKKEQFREMHNNNLTKKKVIRPTIRAATHNRVSVDKTYLNLHINIGDSKTRSEAKAYAIWKEHKA